MNNNDDNSTVNTILIVIILLILVGGLVWFLSAGNAPDNAPVQENDEPGLDVDVSIPEEGGGTGGQGTEDTGQGPD